MRGAELSSLPEGVQRVARLLQQQHGHPHAPVMLDDAAVLVVTWGDRRVDEKKVEALVGLGEKLGRADAGFVKAKTGHSTGGVSPVADVVLDPPAP